MNTYNVYQIRLTDEDRDQVNSMGWSAANVNPRVKAYLDKDMNIQSAFDSGYYNLVSKITAEDLDGVFRVGNIGPEENIERIAPMHSISVGDVIMTPEGKYFGVSGIGFEEVTV